MNTEWQTLLEQAGAQLQGSDVIHFGNPEQALHAARDAQILAPLTHLGLIRIAGADADEFLHNLTSNDVKKLGPNQAQQNSLNTAKGRMLTNLLVWRDNGDLLLMLSQDLLPAIQKKLSMYVLRSKVKLSNASDEHMLIGLSGPNTSALLQQLGSHLPESDGGIERIPGGTIIRVSAQRVYLVLTAAIAPATWQVLSTSAALAGTLAWRWLDIQAGLPRISLATQEAFVPQMINFDALGGLSFNKGCYPGQEIVARTRYLGKIKRRMFLAHSTVECAPGLSLYAASTGEQSCGTVVDAVPAPQGGFDLLAVIQEPCVAAGSIHLGQLDGPALTLGSLPYALPE